MARQSAFDRNQIEASAISETSGILDQLNLPPALIAFMQKNQRMLWGITAVVAVVVITVSLYGSYRDYRIQHAASALDAARIVEEDKRVQLLQQVVEKYSSTPSAAWARVELAKASADKGDVSAAIAELQQVDKGISVKNPMKPLVLYRLAALHEQKQEFTRALEFYQELAAFSGFAQEAHYAMGRVYAAMKKKPEAIAQYQQYLALDEDAGAGSRQPDPMRTLVKYTITQLQ